MAYPGYPGYPQGYPSGGQTYPSYQAEKPSAHIEGPTHVSVTLNAGKPIDEWSPNSPNGHIAGGMVYNNGRLRVPVAGVYMVYCQIYFNPSDARGRYFMKKNQGDLVIVGHSTAGENTEGGVYSSALLRLNAGEEIYIEIEGSHKVWMGPAHCFFGAHLI